MAVLEHPTVTLACVDCANHVAALSALRASMAQCRFGRVLWITDHAPSHVDTRGIEIIPIRTIESDVAYSHFMLRGLLAHIHTPHVLVQQWDGYVASAAAWTSDFLNYDYIGAPWPASPECPDQHRVGNGGFSLRSRRLLEALADPSVPLCHPEDLAIGVTFRPWLEQTKGIAFASLEVAERFSYDGAGAKNTFGFHGMAALSGRMSPAELANVLRQLPLKTRRRGGIRLAARAHFYRSGDFDKALQLLGAMVANPDGHEPDDFISVTLGNSLLQLGRSREAESWWQVQLKKSPHPDQQADPADRDNALVSRAMVGNNLGCVYLGHGQNRLAFRTLDNALIAVETLGAKANPVLRECLEFNLGLVLRGAQARAQTRIFVYPPRLDERWLE